MVAQIFVSTMLAPNVKIPNLPLLSAADLVVSNEIRKLQVEAPSDSHSADEYSDAGAQAPDNATAQRDYDDGDCAGGWSDESSSYISQTNQASRTTTLGSWIDRQRLSTIPNNLSAAESIRAIKRFTFQIKQRNKSLLQAKRSSNINHPSTICAPGDEERPTHSHSSEKNESDSV